MGAGIGQVTLARKLSSLRGVRLIVVCYHYLNEVASLADKIIIHDLYDKEGVLEIAKNERIEAVLSDQHDLYLPTVAYVAEHLNLPGNTFEQVMSYCDKNTFRDICDRVGVPVPKHKRIRDASSICFDEIGFPMIVKPADSQSSIGINKIHSEKDYQRLVKKSLSCSRSKTAILEEFVKGRELVSEGLIYEGKYYNIAFGDRRYFCIEDKFIPSQTLFPAIIPLSLKKMICHYESLIAEYVKPNFAIVHSEWLWDKNSNRLVCVESSLRGGGVFISSHLIPLATGLDINNLLIEYSLIGTINIGSFLSNKVNNAAGYVCFYLPKGVIKRVAGKEILEQSKGVIMASLDTLVEGIETQVLEHKGQRLGPILICAKKRRTLEQRIKRCQSLLEVDVEDIAGHILHPIWT